MTTDCSITTEHAVCHEWVNLTKEEQEDYGHHSLGCQPCLNQMHGVHYTFDFTQQLTVPQHH